MNDESKAGEPMLSAWREMSSRSTPPDGLDELVAHDLDPEEIRIDRLGFARAGRERRIRGGRHSLLRLAGVAAAILLVATTAAWGLWLTQPKARSGVVAGPNGELTETVIPVAVSHLPGEEIGSWGRTSESRGWAFFC